MSVEGRHEVHTLGQILSSDHEIAFALNDIDLPSDAVDNGYKVTKDDVFSSSTTYIGYISSHITHFIPDGLDFKSVSPLVIPHKAKVKGTKITIECLSSDGDVLTEEVYDMIE